MTAGAPPVLTAAGRTWSAVVERRSGGVRPGFDGAFAYWNAARSLSPLDLTGVPRVEGRPSIPVLSLHDIGDLFVPFSMEQVYAQRATANGRSGLFVSRAIRGIGHCDFTQAKLAQGFDDLVGWVRTGHRPAGDAILDRRAVAGPAFGCRFTAGAHPYFVAPACPTGGSPAPRSNR